MNPYDTPELTIWQTGAEVIVEDNNGRIVYTFAFTTGVFNPRADGTRAVIYCTDGSIGEVKVEGGEVYPYGGFYLPKDGSAMKGTITFKAPLNTVPEIGTELGKIACGFPLVTIDDMVSAKVEFQPYLKVEFEEPTWDEYRRMLTIGMKGPWNTVSAVCSYDPDFSSLITSFNFSYWPDIQHAQFDNPEHGTGQILYFQAGFYKGIPTVQYPSAYWSVPVPNPILGRYVRKYNGEDGGDMYIVDINAQSTGTWHDVLGGSWEKTGTELGPKWQTVWPRVVVKSSNTPSA